MKELWLLSCQQPIPGINVVVMNMLLSRIVLRQFAVTEPNLVRRRGLYMDRQALGLPCGCSRLVRKKISGLANVVLAGQQTYHECAGNGMETCGKAVGVMFHSDRQSLYEQAVPAVTVAIPDQAEYESAWKLQGQQPNGTLLPEPEE